MERAQVILLDTHVLLWFFSNDAKLGRAAHKLIALKDRSDPFHISTVSAWEIGLLAKRGRLDLGESAKDWFGTVEKFSALRSIALDTQTAIESSNLPGEFHNDPADRFLVATARMNRFSLLTSDGAILEYAKAGYVKAIDASL